MKCSNLEYLIGVEHWPDFEGVMGTNIKTKSTALYCAVEYVGIVEMPEGHKEALYVGRKKELGE